MFLSRVLRRSLARPAIAQMQTVITVSNRSLVSRTAPLLEKHTMKVPTMGDSITEVRCRTGGIKDKCQSNLLLVREYSVTTMNVTHIYLI
jgi:hypothetical protein